MWGGKSEGCSPASPATQNKYFLLKAAKGLWLDNPPVFPGVFGALCWARHFLLWEEASGAGLGPALRGERKGEVEKCGLGWGSAPMLCI